MRPQSTARRSSPASRTIMLRPISPRPPSGASRTAGSMGGSRGGSGRATPAGSPADCAIPLRMVSRGLRAAQEPRDPRELLEVEALRPATPVHGGEPEGAADRVPRKGPAERVPEGLAPLSERRLHDLAEARRVLDGDAGPGAEDDLDHGRLHGRRRAERTGRHALEEGEVGPELPEHGEGAVDAPAGPRHESLGDLALEHERERVDRGPRIVV